MNTRGTVRVTPAHTPRGQSCLHRDQLICPHRKPRRRFKIRIEEVEALSSIYGDEWCVIDEASRIFCIKISSNLEEPKLTACLQIILPSDYPSAAPPIYQINAAWLRGPERVKLANSLEDIYVEHAGESILYLWVERVREFLVEKSQSSGTGFTARTRTASCRTVRTMARRLRGGDCSIYCRFWMYTTSWLLCPAGMGVFCWALTASSTSTTALGTSWWRRATSALWMRPPNQERRPKDQKAKRLNEMKQIHQSQRDFSSSLDLP
ncbi:protein IMPACT isoform X3 [Oryzias melastigma]|uniref:protein IMPACT isoform X3 n=1 Tax=Oryzias melastigma TaxID=30732 RepID=UPI00168D6CEF|nr:protein IMPACT isoform X3 [Oryzias melastigma]